MNLSRAGNYEALETASRSSHAAVDLFVCALSETGRAPCKLLLGIFDQHTKGVDRLNILLINGEGLVSILHSLFRVTGGEYEEGP